MGEQQSNAFLQAAEAVLLETGAEKVPERSHQWRLPGTNALIVLRPGMAQMPENWAATAMPVKGDATEGYQAQGHSAATLRRFLDGFRYERVARQRDTYRETAKEASDLFNAVKAERDNLAKEVADLKGRVTEAVGINIGDDAYIQQQDEKIAKLERRLAVSQEQIDRLLSVVGQTEADRLLEVAGLTKEVADLRAQMTGMYTDEQVASAMSEEWEQMAPVITTELMREESEGIGRTFRAGVSTRLRKLSATPPEGERKE